MDVNTHLRYNGTLLLVVNTSANYWYRYRTLANNVTFTKNQSSAGPQGKYFGKAENLGFQPGLQLSLQPDL